MNLESMDLVTQHIVMARDLNGHGNLFGGVMLSWVDEAAALYTMEKIGYSNIVTVNIDDVNFVNPAKMGEIVQIYAKVEKTGKSSITLLTSTITISPMTNAKREVISCRLTFVCLDELGKPYPFFQNKNP